MKEHNLLSKHPRMMPFGILVLIIGPVILYFILRAAGVPAAVVSGGGVIRVSDSPGADLRAIHQKGVPAISPLQDARHYFDYHHTPADTFDKVRVDEMRREIEIIGPLVYRLAQHE